MRTVASVLILSALALPASLSAQVQPALGPSTVVRVTVARLGIIQQEVSFGLLRGDTLAVVADSTMTFALAALDRLEVRREVRHPLIGAVIGSLAGVTAYGAGYVMATWEDPSAKALLPGAVLGAAIGGITGWFVRTARWEEVALDELHVRFARQRDGRLGLGLSVAF